ncbi:MULTISPECIES: Gfo/Idh/MocA family oxidoreductase [unclassified Rhizobium]|uniref:Gfo/Idh/MocA family protein n=1 Tax=unclassified Rhizobium TaxID=2613769 RepID=UPI001160B2C8|nr:MULTISPECIES: Gfo/Idh/MocA family oxidoreductase [unclassified Rhizobium]TQX86918.1 Gfo/Idh/MocA family oxidoreductase [Rhizobium sp. rho-13.1]TQY05586.1 Gfo/Idh/MocA family oxidoreductase [Rhizobium sp. rho-1.1]
MADKRFAVAIIGCGLIGQKRARALGPRGKLIACADSDVARARSLAAAADGAFFEDWRELLRLTDVEVVIIATLHDSLAEITLAAVRAGKHVLVEKPAARTSAELLPVMCAAQEAGVKVHVGFSHRYHRALRKAKEIVGSGALGELMFIRARYGHGGRLGYDREWRANPQLSGGGELIDQGPHLIDLSRWFLGDFTSSSGFAHTYYWDMPVDDNGFMLLKTEDKKAAFLHVSCTEWKNLFSMEIYGRDGKLEISGLGGSYGVEKLTYYKMLPQMGPPETSAWEYPMADNSWEVEIAEFFEDITLNRAPEAGLNDAFEALKIIEKIYQESGYDHSA